MSCSIHPEWNPQGFEWHCPHCTTTAKNTSKPATKSRRPASNIKTDRASDLNGWEAQRTRKRIRERDGYRCQSCKCAVRVGQVDHIKPLDQGGTEDDSNLQLLCHACHVDKTNRDNGYRVRTRSGVDGIPIDANHHWNK